MIWSKLVDQQSDFTQKVCKLVGNKYDLSMLQIKIKSIRMGSNLCNQQYTLSYSIQQHQYSRLSNSSNIGIDAQSMQFIQTNRMPVWKHKNNDKYYCGNFHDGKAHGLGILFIPNHMFFKGNLEKGLPSGKGFLNFLNRHQVYQGGFQNGMAHGYGRLENNTKNNNFLFEGEWRDSQAIKGKLLPIMNQNIQFIDIQNFILHDGLIKFKNGDVYKGKLNTYFQPHGQGQLIYNPSSKAEKYTGSWFRGKFNGKGIFKWKDGSQYNGDYVDGQKQGSGIFRFPSGKYYNGSWLEGSYHGKGTMYDSSNRMLIEGLFFQGLPIVQGTFQKQKIRPFYAQKLPTVSHLEKNGLQKN